MKKYLAIIIGIILLLLNVDVVLAGSMSCTFSIADNGAVTPACSPVTGGIGIVPAPVPPPAPVPTPAPADNCTTQGLSNREIQISSVPGGFLTGYAIGPNQSISFVLNSPGYPMSGQYNTTYSDSEKVMSISTQKCDWSASLSDPFKGVRCLSQGTDPGVSWSNVPSYTACVLAQNKTYYVNLRNAKLIDGAIIIRPIQDSCMTGACNFSIRF